MQLITRHNNNNMLGNNFVKKCIESQVLHDPWPHTVTEDHIDKDSFDKLHHETQKLLEIRLRDMPTHKTTTENTTIYSKTEK